MTTKRLKSYRFQFPNTGKTKAVCIGITSTIFGSFNSRVRVRQKVEHSAKLRKIEKFQFPSTGKTKVGSGRDRLLLYHAFQFPSTGKTKEGRNDKQD